MILIIFSEDSVNYEGYKDSMQSTKKQELSFLEAQEEKKDIFTQV